MEISDMQIGDYFEDVLLETYRDGKVSRPRVRPIEYFPTGINVEFPRHIRDSHPVNTRFRAHVKVCQKTQGDGEPKGPPYLRAATDSITLVVDYNPRINIIPILKPGSKSGRAYDYQIKGPTKNIDEVSLSQLRAIAYEVSKESERLRGELGEIRYNRSLTIRSYAIARAKGICERCGKEAPFVRKNGTPYLEVHHIEELANDGADHPTNVAAVCPNCHAHVTHGVDRDEQNKRLKEVIRKKEALYT